MHYGHLTLTERTYQIGIKKLSSRDIHLAGIIRKWGNPPFWTLPTGFTGIVLAILSQQVTLESARSTFCKLEQSVDSVTPEDFLSLDDTKLFGIGFSRQKASYVRGIAEKIIAGEFELDHLENLNNDKARERLMEIKGIGPWTADTYLLFALRRSDAWPSGDLALEKAVQEVEVLSRAPGKAEVDSIADRWRPWRAVAARMLWHFYLSERGRNSSV
jgi:DNA-3-methyladenine glycosylase II